MERQQPGPSRGADKPGATQDSNPQMTASQPDQPKAPTYAAFGTSGGAAIVLRDLASI